MLLFLNVCNAIKAFLFSKRRGQLFAPLCPAPSTDSSALCEMPHNQALRVANKIFQEHTQHEVTPLPPQVTGLVREQAADSGLLGHANFNSATL